MRKIQLQYIVWTLVSLRNSGTCPEAQERHVKYMRDVTCVETIIRRSLLYTTTNKAYCVERRVQVHSYEFIQSRILQCIRCTFYERTCSAKTARCSCKLNVAVFLVRCILTIYVELSITCGIMFEMLYIHVLFALLCLMHASGCYWPGLSVEHGANEVQLLVFNPVFETVFQRLSLQTPVRIFLQTLTIV